MGVAPVFKFFPAVDIPVGYVHAAQIAYALVYYTYFAVVTPIDTCGQLRECNTEERICLDAVVAQALEEA